MKFILYPADIEASTAEFSSDFQRGFYDQFKKFAVGLTKPNKGDRAAAAVAIQLYAHNINCKVEFDRNRETGFIDRVVIVSGPEEL